MPFEESVRIPKCLNYLSSSDHFPRLVRLGSDHQIIWKCSKEYLWFRIVLGVERGLKLGPSSAPGYVRFAYLGLRSLSYLGCSDMAWNQWFWVPHLNVFYRRWWWSRELRRDWPSYTRGRGGGDKVEKVLGKECAAFGLVLSVGTKAVVWSASVLAQLLSDVGWKGGKEATSVWCLNINEWRHDNRTSFFSLCNVMASQHSFCTVAQSRVNSISG